MVRLGTGCRKMSEATAPPALDDSIPRRPKNGPRLKAWVTCIGAVPQENREPNRT